MPLSYETACLEVVFRCRVASCPSPSAGVCARRVVLRLLVIAASLWSAPAVPLPHCSPAVSAPAPAVQPLRSPLRCYSAALRVTAVVLPGSAAAFAASVALHPPHHERQVMSFFDEVETTVANTRFLQAQEESAPIHLALKPIQQIKDRDDALRPTVTIDLLLRPNTVAQYLFKQFLCTQGQQDAVHLITAIEQYRKVGGSQRAQVARRIMKEHPILAQPPPADAAVPAAGLAYIMPAAASSSSSAAASSSSSAAAPAAAASAADGAAPADSSSPPHPLAPASPSKAAGAAASSSSSSSPAAAPVPPPCLELILAAPLTSHPLCSQLASTASVELIELQRELAAHPPGAPPPTLFDPLSLRVAQRLQDQVGPFVASPFYTKLVQLEDYCAHDVKLNEFRIFRVLGRGAFGAVSAVQKIDTHAIYAMKEMGKKQIKADQSEWMVINECKVLSKMSSPFVLNLKYSFHEDDTLYLIFDMCAGGDLKFHLRAAAGKDKCFDLARARFYAAEVLLGLEHLHAQDIVYRDLKPNNILLNQEGHVVISDLGLTIKLRKNKLLKHLAGTAGYWSPEVVSKTGTYKTSDYWSYGVMLYEMLTGSRPACGCNKKSKEWCPFGQKKNMEDNALDPEGVLKIDVAYPADKIPPAARQLLEALFNPDPLARLGANGIEEIKNAAFFADVDWEAMSLCEVPPPYIPDSRTVNANSIGEVGEFSKAAFKHIALTEDDDKIYEGFRYTSAEGMQLELIEALKKMDHPNGPNQAQGEGKNSDGSAKTENTGGCCIIL